MRRAAAALVPLLFATQVNAATPTAADFLATIGANVHLGATDTSYADVARVQRQLAFLGIARVRADLANLKHTSPYSVLGFQGVLFDLVVMVQPEAALPLLRTLSPWIASVEGPNEVNVTPVRYDGKSGAAAVPALQHALYAMVKQDPALHAIPVVSFSVAQGGNFADYGANADADFANVHAYAEFGVPPFWMLKPVIDSVVTTPGRPFVVTEIGNYTLNDSKSGVSEHVQAAWLLDTLLDTFRLGAHATYVYELQDERADKTGHDSEQHYGLFTFDGRAKQSAEALRKLTTILRDPKPANRNATPPSFTIPDNPADVFSTILARSDGSFDLVLWAEPEIWDRDRHADKPAAPRTIAVKFEQPLARVAIYDPMVSTTVASTAADVTDIAVTLTDHPVVARIVPR